MICVNQVIENFSLDWNKCVTYSSDNTNSMVGHNNSLLKKIKDSQTLRLNKKFLMLVVHAILPIFVLEKEQGNSQLTVKIL